VEATVRVLARHDGGRGRGPCCGAPAGAAAYAIKAVCAAAPGAEEALVRRREREWQRDQLPAPVRALVLDDQRRRNATYWFVFEG
jgi:hypothetical protein